MDQRSLAINFDITNHCQSRCIVCPRTDPVTGDTLERLTLEHIDLETFTSRVSQLTELTDNGYDITIKLCGERGDPVMHKDIQYILDFLNEQSFIKKVQLHTNGGIRNPSWYTHLGANHKNLVIWFGIDGIDHETNWLYRTGVNGNLAFENMRAFADAGGRAKWQFLIFKWNWHQIPQAKRLAEEWGVELTTIMNTANFDGKVDDELLPEIEKLTNET